MTESARTGMYVVAAAAALGIAWLARPASPDRTVFEDSGEPFFISFDPLAAKSMEITSFNNATTRRHTFKVAQVNGRWSIPSHEGYPADASEHLAQAAASVMDLKKGPKVSDNTGDHALYGVVDPAAEGASNGSGTRVTLQDEANKTLVDLIIGKAVKDAEQVHYVRVPGKDRVYTAKVNTQHLSTKFEDWIERDLLKLNTSLLKNVIIDGYSIDELNGTIVPGDRLKLTYGVNPAAAPHSPDGAMPQPSWSLEDLKPGETLETEPLDELRSALADLKIIDVHKKPAGLSGQLASTGALQLDRESVDSLASRGFYLVQADQGYKLLSNEGEIILRTSEGVEYMLRFGEVVNVEGGSDLNAEGDDTIADDQNGRFLFVTTSFNAAMIDVPQYLPVPAAATAPADTQPGAETQPAATMPEDPAREAAIGANDQMRKDYEAKIKAGEDKVKELNARFADWYYVVSDDVYQKLRVRRGDLVPSAASSTPPISNSPPMPAGPAPAETSNE